MRLLLVLALVATAASGCIRAPAEPLEPAPQENAPEVPAALPEPQVLTASGHITASPLGRLAHMRETEALVYDIQREGFVLDVAEPPMALQVHMAWSGPGNALMMVSSPHVDGKGVEYFTEMSADAEQCLAIPPAEIVAGAWQVMIHTMNAVNADYTFTITTVGGAATLPMDQPHSSAEAAETTEGEALPCPEPAAPEA